MKLLQRSIVFAVVAFTPMLASAQAESRTGILLLAHRIGGQAADINASLEQAVTNTAALKELNTTADHVGVIVAGLQRGRQRLGG